MPTVRITIAIGTAAAALALVTAGCASSAGRAESARTEDVTTTSTAPPATTLRFDYEQDAPSIGTSVCSPYATCVVPFSLHGTTVGDFEGTAVQAGAGAVMPDGSLFATSTVVFSGTVSGCGTGTAVLQSTGLNRDGATSGTAA